MRRRAGVGRRILGKALLGISVLGALAVGVPLLTHEPKAAASAFVLSPPSESPNPILGKSGLPIPRFVSLKAKRVNVRVWPGEDYNVDWTFTRSDLPVEVIQEFDNWRRIRDSDGSVGWVFHSLLSGRRTGVVAPWAGDERPLPIRSSASDSGDVTAYLEARVMTAIDRCSAGWCKVSGDGFAGWIEQARLWGVYPNEEVD
jgi:SH3-like domain-containing protein